AALAMTTGAAPRFSSRTAARALAFEWASLSLTRGGTRMRSTARSDLGPAIPADLVSTATTRAQVTPKSAARECIPRRLVWSGADRQAARQASGSGVVPLQHILESPLVLVVGVVQLAGACHQRRIAGAALHVARYQHRRDAQLLAGVDPLVAAHARVEIAERAKPPVAVLVRSETDRQLADRGGLSERDRGRADFDT